MKVYIQCNSNMLPYNKNAYLALEGFQQMGIQTILFYNKKGLEDSTLEDIVVGGVGRVKGRLEELGKTIQDIDYPKELEKYLGRKVWKGKVKDILCGKIDFPIFMKPIKGKLFHGGLIKSEVDLIGKINSSSDFEVYYSELISIRAEYRCYVRYGKILDIKRYKGNLDVFYDYQTIQSLISDYVSAPVAYGIDVGITKEGKTVLIEVNDGYSLGNYGLDSLLYAKLLSARWAEMTGTEDICAFDIVNH